MASSYTTAPTSTLAGNIARRRFLGVSQSPVLGLPAIAAKGKVRCAAEGKQEGVTAKAMRAPLLTAVSSAVVVASPAAMALVDERMSTEGTGLPFGLSNNLLGWILFGMFGLIWALYFIYTSGLEEDEESGLSL